MTDALEKHEATVSIGGKIITNLRSADDIDGLAGKEAELVELGNRFDKASTDYGMEISSEKTKIATNSAGSFTMNIEVNSQQLESVDKFKYLGSSVTGEGSKPKYSQR